MDIKTIKESEEILRNLRSIQEQHKNDVVLTFGICISDMARDSADSIESLLFLVKE